MYFVRKRSLFVYVIMERQSIFIRQNVRVMLILIISRRLLYYPQLVYRKGKQGERSFTRGK